MLVDGAGTAAAFNVKIAGHNGVISYPKIKRTGRGSNGAPMLRLGGAVGTFTMTGRAQLTGFPVPTKPQFASGTLTLAMQLDGSTSPPTVKDKVDLPAKVTGIQWALEEGDDDANPAPGQDVWTFIATVELSGQPVWTWQGTQVTTSAPGPSDQETYEGLQKTYDAQGFLTAAVQRIDCDGVGDSDSAESAKLIAMVAAAVSPPQPNLKVVSAAYSKSLEADDSNGGQIVITWGLMDSVDQQVVPLNVFTQDAGDQTSTRTLAQIWHNTDSPPTQPSPPSGLKIRSVVDAAKNLQYTIRIWTFAKTNTIDDLTLPKIFTDVDPKGVNSRASSAAMDGNATLPGGYKKRSTYTVNTTPDHVLQIITGGLTDSYDDLTLPKTWTKTDAHGMNGESSAAAVNGNATVQGGFKARSLYTVSINDGTLLQVAAGGLTDSYDDATFPESRRVFDPTGVGSSASSAGINGLLALTPTAAGTGYTSAPTITITGGGGSGATGVGFLDGLGGVIPVLTNPGKDYTSAPTVAFSGGGGSGAAATAVIATGTLPAPPPNLVVIESEVVQMVDGKTRTIVRLGPQNRDMELANRATRSSRNSSQFIDLVGQILNSNDSNQNVADSQWTSFQAVANSYGLSVETINPFKKLIVFEFINSGIRVVTSARGGPRVVPAMVDDDGDVNLFVTSNRSRGSGSRLITLSRAHLSSSVQRQLVVVRLIKSATVPDQGDLFGEVNDATFLNQDAGTVVYRGDQSDDNIALSSSHPNLMFYHFDTDDNGFFDSIPEDWFKRALTLATSSTATGWVKASDLGLDGDIDTPDTGDFSVFVD